MTPAISVVIPAHNSAEFLDLCLQALAKSDHLSFETIVVDDGSTDNTTEVARRHGAIVIGTERRGGPSIARNLGTKASHGDILFFLDSDVCVHTDTLSLIAESFSSDLELDALIGSYDDTPASRDFLSQYRNLMHSYVHHTGAVRASTFWSGCGAIRRALFDEHQGFNASYGRPAIEDIELGYRLIQAKRKIVLDRSILVTHLKQWTFWRLIKTDMLDRGIPWTELIYRDRCMPNDLNLQLSHRVSVALAFLLVGLSAGVALLEGAYLLIPLIAIVSLMLTRWWGEIGIYDRPRRAYTKLVCVFALVVGVACFYRMYGLIAPLALGPALLVVRHRYRQQGRTRNWQRWFVVLYILGSVATAVRYLPAYPLVISCFAVFALLGLLNSQFYVFLAGKRGVPFMLAAIPFHMLYHFYNGLSFIVGTAKYCWIRPAKRAASDASVEALP